MSHHDSGGDFDSGPGVELNGEEDVGSGFVGYVVGLALAAALTLASFGLPATGLVWGPALAVALIVLAIAQMGIHLVFFLHITTAPDNTNNVLALAFGVLIVFLIMGGSIWIMAHLNANMTPMRGGM